MNKSSTLKSALFVVGSGLAVAPAAALELGDIKVHSTLGQPLRASIAYALAPNEALSDTCVTLQRNMTSNGLPAAGPASLIVTNGVIAITGGNIIREPIVTMRLSIRCPYTSQLSREYMMFIDPADTPKPTAAPVAAQVASKPASSAPATTRVPVTVRRRPMIREPIGEATRYQVQPGETLSEIAQRVENRPVGVWKTVNTIFDMNPDAFIDNDPNNLKAGSWLTIPVFSADTPSTVASEPAAVAYEPAEFAAQPAAEVAPVEAVFVEPAAAGATNEPESSLANLQPGDVFVDSYSPYVAPVDSVSDESVVIPDTQLEGPQTTSSSPNLPVAVIQTAAPREPGKPAATNWLLWLGGGGVAIIIALLLFGRSFRDRFGSTPIAPAVPQRRQKPDFFTQQMEAMGNADMEIQDDSPTVENLALDADLIIGTGLQDGTEVDVAQDFGFAAMADLDLELPADMSGGAESAGTDIIPPPPIDMSSILESEVLPGDDYDMSVVMDATKMPHPDDVTKRDLEAVQVDANDETLITDDYTVSQDADYKIVEQDYEDEMTATQALNVEIQKAAEKRAVRINDDNSDETTEMPLATIHELDLTAQLLPKKQEEISDDDDTGINPTVDMDAEEETVEVKDDDTVEMPRDDSKAG